MSQEPIEPHPPPPPPPQARKGEIDPSSHNQQKPIAHKQW